MSIVNSIKRSVQNVIRRGQLTRLDDAKKTQNIQIVLMDDEVVENVERFQQYGFSSAPSDGDVLCVAVGAKSNQLVSICINDSNTRINIEGDDVAVYHKEGHKIVLSAGEKITVTCKDLVIDAETSVTITSPDTNIIGKLNVTDAVTFKSSLDVKATTTTDGFAMGGGGEAKVTGSLHVTEDIKADQKGIFQDSVHAKDHISDKKGSYNDHIHPVTGSVTGEPNDA